MNSFSQSVNSFSQSVIENIAHYVYVLVDPRNNKIFYVGEGQGNRVFNHVQDAIDGVRDSLKLDTIREILSEGLKVKHYIIRHGLSQEVAFEIESTLIDILTYSDFNLETILSNAVAGHHSWNKGIKSADEISILYDCKEIEPCSQDKLICININKSFVNNEEYDIYDATRHYWKMNINRARCATYVLAIYRGIVRAVFRPIEWYPSKTYAGRIEFEGEQVQDSPYLNRSIKNTVNCGQNPINYINL